VIARIVVGCVVVCGVALAQPITTGSVRGRVVTKTGELAIGATIVATSSALQGEQTAIADETGSYFLTALPPGMYTLTVFYGGSELRRDNVIVQLGKQAVVNLTIDLTGEVVEIKGTAPMVDSGSTKIGVTITEDYTRNIPTGRTFGTSIAAPAGTVADRYGVSISGATSPENAYVVEGILTNDAYTSTLATDLPHEFIAETEIITAGYTAEYGRAMGGVVNVITKQGSNEFHGSLFFNLEPGTLVARAQPIDVEGGSFSSRTELNVRYDLGGEVGGPIVKDKLWFHVGFDPNVRYDATERTISRQLDDDQDGVPDRDPNTGFTKHDPLVTTRIPTRRTTYYFTGKLTTALGENHRGQLSVFGNPATGNELFTIDRAPATTVWQHDDGNYDGAAKWTSKLDGGRTEIAAVAGLHYEYFSPTASTDPTIRYNYERSLYDFADVEVGGIDACNDNDPADPYPEIRNCPIARYASQGNGLLGEFAATRATAALSVTRRARFFGHHVLKAGVDTEAVTSREHDWFTGGFFLSRAANLVTPNRPDRPGRWALFRFMQVDRYLPNKMSDVALEDDQYMCVGDHAVCSFTDGYSINTHDTNYGAYLQDSWLIVPNLTVNAGVRWDRQNVYVADAIVGKVSPDGEIIPERALQLDNIAPRLGAIYDPTSEGRAKLFTHYGRFYEQAPLSLNQPFMNGVFSNQLLNYNRYLPTQGQYDPRCDVDHGTPDLVNTLLMCSDRSEVVNFGGGIGYVAPGLRGEYVEEIVAGAEYEVVPEIKVGVAYQHREVPVVIEDMSIDGGQYYFLANPGENFDAQAAELRASAEQLAMSDDPHDQSLAAVLDRRADQLEETKKFDKPIRRYDALQLTASQRPTKRSLVLASYTYSVNRGNYPGLFSPETGQLTPNLNSIYDLPDMLANRTGYIGLDRTHNFKTDAFYEFDVRRAALTVGASFRALSGVPYTALGSSPHVGYRTGESYLLQAGTLHRSPLTSHLDLHLAVAYRLDKGTRLDGFVRLFNVFDQQDELSVDQNYTYEPANPIVGGDRADLDHIKAIDLDGHELGRTVVRNKNFEHTKTRQTPRSIQIGVRWLF